MTIVAEIGINHNGDMKLAKELIQLAKENGASLAKLQLYDAEKDCKDSEWYEYLKKCELSFVQAKMLFNYGKKIDMEVFFSVDNAERVDWCEQIGVKRYKVGYGQRKKMKLLQAITATGKPIIISGDPIPGWEFVYRKRLTRLYCIPKYPATLEDCQFNKVFFNSEHRIQNVWEGFSDHTIGLDAAKIAIVKGAKIIERHFTIDKNMEGPDHKFSMTPDELAELVRWEQLVKECL